MPVLHSTWKRSSHSQVFYRDAVLKNFTHGRVSFEECVPLTISCHLHFLRISKVSSMLHHGPVGRVHIKECYFIFICTFLFFFFLLFFIKKKCFWWIIEFPQQNIKQSETGIGDNKVSLELYVSQKNSL